MDILRIKNKYAAVALFLMLSVALQAQDYGALKYMLQKRPANERFESNKFNEHLFFSAGLGPYGLLTSGGQDGMGMVHSCSWGASGSDFGLFAVGSI